MKILVTGFDPFGGETVNPSWEAVKLLPDALGEHEIIKQLLPTEFIRAEATLLAAIDTHAPGMVVCCGQAAGRSALSFERIAINLRDAAIPDNAGFQPKDEAVFEGGETAYFVTAPVKAMTAALRDAEIPAEVSLSAGSFVCNDVLYTLLRRLEGSRAMGAFVHLPLSPEQAHLRQPPLPSMEIGEMARGLEIAIEAAAEFYS